jgi:predicted GIY-YIG superfamily endonuclease
VTVPNETDTASRKAAVYRLYAADGTLLYIGSSYDPDKRCEAHHHTPWWAEVARRTDEWFPNRWKAYSAETAAIWKEHPKHNLAGTLEYRRAGTSNPPRQRAGYMAYTWRRDACATLDVVPVYKAVLDSPESMDPSYVRRAERAAAELTEDIQGLNWDGRRRAIERGRQLVIRTLHDEGANDADVATVMAVLDARLRSLPYLHDDEPHGSRHSEDGAVVYVVHAERASLSRKGHWRFEMHSLGISGPWVDSLDEVEDTARLVISKWMRRPYEQVAVRVRVAE